MDLQLPRPGTRVKCWPTPASTTSVICWDTGGERVGPGDPGLWDLHDTGQQWDIQEESQRGPTVDSAAETRVSNQTRDSSHVKVFWIKGLLCDSLCHTVTSIMRFPLSSSFLPLFYLKFYFDLLGGLRDRGQMRGDRRWVGLAGMM